MELLLIGLVVILLLAGAFIVFSTTEAVKTEENAVTEKEGYVEMNNVPSSTTTQEEGNREELIEVNETVEYNRQEVGTHYEPPLVPRPRAPVIVPESFVEVDTLLTKLAAREGIDILPMEVNRYTVDNVRTLSVIYWLPTPSLSYLEPLLELLESNYTVMDYEEGKMVEWDRGDYTVWFYLSTINTLVVVLLD